MSETVPEVEARPFQASDSPELERLAAAARLAVGEARGGPLWVQHDALEGTSSFSALAADSSVLVGVGTLDAQPLGYLVATVNALHDGRPLARIVELYVDPDARELGLGEALIDLVVAWATERGCAGIDALALPGDRATKNFFEDMGLVARAIVVHRPLETRRS